MTSKPLILPQPIAEAMLVHARECLPNECCGMLASLTGSRRVERIYPLVNTLHSPIAYAADSRELLRLHREMRRDGLEEIAIYHSHPTSEPIPSRRDLEMNGYGTSIVHIIIGREGSMRGWLLGESSFEEAELIVDE